MTHEPAAVNYCDGFGREDSATPTNSDTRPSAGPMWFSLRTASRLPPNRSRNVVENGVWYCLTVRVYVSGAVHAPLAATGSGMPLRISIPFFHVPCAAT